MGVLDIYQRGLSQLTRPLGGVGEELEAVADPTRAGSRTTEHLIRFSPVAPLAALQDSRDFFSGRSSSPAPGVGLSLSAVRQFDDSPGGGILDPDTLGETFGSGTSGAAGGSGRSGGAMSGLLVKALVGVVAVVALVVAVSSFFGGLAEGVTS